MQEGSELPLWLGSSAGFSDLGEALGIWGLSVAQSLSSLPVPCGDISEARKGHPPAELCHCVWLWGQPCPSPFSSQGSCQQQGWHRHILKLGFVG